MTDNDLPQIARSDDAIYNVDYSDPESVKGAMEARMRDLVETRRLRAAIEEKIDGNLVAIAEISRKKCELYESALGEKLRDWRKARGWSQARMAEELGVKGFEMHQTTVAKIENGSRPLRVAEAVAISEVMGMTPLSVFYGPSPDQEPLDTKRLRQLMESAEKELELAQEMAESAMKNVLYHQVDRAHWAEAINRSALESDRERESDGSGS